MITCRTKRHEEVKVLETIEPEGVNTIGEDGEWEELNMAVDSGATETVVNEDMVDAVPTIAGPASKRGVEYEIANGVQIPNKGGKKFIGQSGEGKTRKITAQVCDVNKALLSVRKVVTAGNRVVFDPSGSYIEDVHSGEKMWLEDVNGMYMLKIWINRKAQSPF